MLFSEILGKQDVASSATECAYLWGAMIKRISFCLAFVFFLGFFSSAWGNPLCLPNIDDSSVLDDGIAPDIDVIPSMANLDDLMERKVPPGTALPLDVKHPVLPVYAYSEAFIDSTGELTIEDVSSPEFSDRFKKLEPPSYPRLGEIEVWWLRMNIVAVSADAMETGWNVLVLDNMPESIELYLPTGNGGFSMQKTGRHDDHPMGHMFLNMDLPYAKTYPQVYTVFIRFTGEKHRMQRMVVVARDIYVAEYAHGLLFIGSFFGIFGTVILLNLFLYVIAPHRTQLWYLLLLVTLTVMYALRNNILEVHLDYWSTEFIFSMVIASVLMSSVMFTRSFLHTRKYAPWIDFALVAYMVCSFLFAFIPLMRQHFIYENSIHLLGLAAPVVFIGAALVCWLKGAKSARLYLLGVAVFPLGAMFEILADIGLVRDTFFTNNGTQIGAELMALLLSLAIVLRIRNLQREKREAEEARQETAFRFEAVFNDAFQYMSLLTPDGTVVEANKAVLDALDLPKEAVLGTKIWDSPMRRMDQEKGACRHIQGVERAAKGETLRYEMSEPSPQTGEPRHLDLSMKPVLNDDGEVALILAEARDITELREAQKQAFRADKFSALGRLVAGVAHEINNPNNFIYFNLPVLREYLSEIRAVVEHEVPDVENKELMGQPAQEFFDDVFQLLADMEHGSERITGIVGQLKHYVKNGDEQERKPQQTAEVIDRVMTLAGKQVRKMVKTLDVQVQEGLPAVNINAGRIEQVLINLLINAGQAADKEDSYIRLNVAAKNDGVRITVADNGAGVPDELQERVFEPFFTTKSSGTGQGLAISKQIIEDHQGTISLESTPGEGATIMITLPGVAAEDGKEEEHGKG